MPWKSEVLKKEAIERVRQAGRDGKLGEACLFEGQVIHHFTDEIIVSYAPDAAPVCAIGHAVTAAESIMANPPTRTIAIPRKRVGGVQPDASTQIAEVFLGLTMEEARVLYQTNDSGLAPPVGLVIKVMEKIPVEGEED